MEVTQFTYFQQVGGIECDPVAVELTYGLERLAMYIQGVENVYDLDFNGDGVTYGDVFLRAEREYSAHNFEAADPDMLYRHFIDAEAECQAKQGETCQSGDHQYLLNQSGKTHEGQRQQPGHHEADRCAGECGRCLRQRKAFAQAGE